MHVPQEQDRKTSRQSPFVGDDGRPLAFSSCEISVIAGPDLGRSIVTEKRVIRIGADDDNDLVLTDEAVSRHHLEVCTKDGSYVVADLGSTNGTFAGALQVVQATLRGSTELRVGNDILRFTPRDHRERVAPSLSRRCGDLWGSSPAMRAVFGLIERVAPTELPVLVSGETGTGKQLVAEAVHQLSRRAEKPFVTLDCGALPPTLIESALFGYERGAFTGADRAYAGVFERAHGGTLFLDELGELPLDLQPKLLRAVERGEIERLRGEGSVRVDVRIVAATNRSLPDMVREGRFRSDLYYRLAVVELPLPPLRERPGDIQILIDHFVDKFGEEISEAGRELPRLDRDTIAALARQPYPGNVRELANVVRRTLLLGGMPSSPAITEARPSAPMEGWDGLSFKDAKSRLVDRFEREYLEDVLRRHRYNVSSASREAGIGRRHLHRLLDKYGIATRREA